jgi:mannosyltransferase
VPEPEVPVVPWWRSTATIVRLGPVVVGATVVAGIIARFVADSPLWLDEALTVNIASEPFGDIAERLRHDGHPPLFYWMLHLWMEVVGDGDTAVRALSGVFAVATLPVGWVIGRRLGGRAGAASVVALLAASPFLIRYGSEARQYSLVSLLSLVGWLVLDRARERPSLARLAPVTLVSGLLLLTHYWAAFLLGAAGLLLLVGAFRGGDPDQRRADLRAAVALALGGVLFAPWVPNMLYQLENTGTPWADPGRPTAALAAAVSTLGSGAPEGFLLVIVVGSLLMIGVLGVRRSGALVLEGPHTPATARLAAALAIGVVVAGVASFVGGSAFEARYFAVYTPLALVVAGLGLALTPPATRVALIALVAVLGGLAYLDDVVPRDRTQAGEIVSIVLAEAGPDDVLLVCPDQLGPSHERLLDGAVPVLPYPDLELDPRFIEWVDYLDRFAAADPAAVVDELVAQRPPGSTIWLAWESHYRIVGDDCAEVANQLGRATASGEVLVNSDPAAYFEHASLHRYRVPG